MLALLLLLLLLLYMEDSRRTAFGIHIGAVVVSGDSRVFSILFIFFYYAAARTRAAVLRAITIKWWRRDTVQCSHILRFLSFCFCGPWPLGIGIGARQLYSATVRDDDDNANGPESSALVYFLLNNKNDENEMLKLLAVLLLLLLLPLGLALPFAVNH